MFQYGAPVPQKGQKKKDWIATQEKFKTVPVDDEESKADSPTSPSAVSSQTKALKLAQLSDRFGILGMQSQLMQQGSLHARFLTCRNVTNYSRSHFSIGCKADQVSFFGSQKKQRSRAKRLPWTITETFEHYENDIENEIEVIVCFFQKNCVFQTI